MLAKEVCKYIEEHKLGSDYLFLDWNEFLDLLYLHGSYVKQILWFEHVLIGEQPNSMGAGGFKDLSNPQYMYAETQIYEAGMENKSITKVKEYIEAIIAAYPKNKLIPSFFIKE